MMFHNETRDGPTTRDLDADAAGGHGGWDVTWRHGTANRRGTEPPIQVHMVAEHTAVLRQSKTLSHEAPFIFVLFGRDRAVLLDTGATSDAALFPLRAQVDSLIGGWLAKHPHPAYELVVAHSHGHGDHVAADGQFTDRPATRVVGRDSDAVHTFFGLSDSTREAVFDLGGRVLHVLASPGHHAAAITIYDPCTATLFTGDTVYPGRLYIEDHTAFTTSLQQLVTFAATHPVHQVIGCHVEMTNRPGRDYPLGATYQPRERKLPMTSAQLSAVRDATVAATGRRGIHRYDDFVLYVEPRDRHLRRLLARAKAHQVLRRAHLR